MALRTPTYTATADSKTIQIHAAVEYVADPALIRAIRQVLRKADRWKHDCCGKKAGKRHCESYGCTSLDELLEPLRQLKLKVR